MLLYEEVFSTFYIYTCVYCCINCCKFLHKERWAGSFRLNQANTSDCGNGMSNSRLMFQRQWQLSGFSILHHDSHLTRLSSRSPTQPAFISFLCCAVTLFQNTHTGDSGSLAGPLSSPDVSTCSWILPHNINSNTIQL